MNIEKIDLSKSPWNFKIDGANTSVFVEWESTTDSVFIFHLQHKGGRVEKAEIDIENPNEKIGTNVSLRLAFEEFLKQ